MGKPQVARQKSADFQPPAMVENRIDIPINLGIHRLLRTRAFKRSSCVFCAASYSSKGSGGGARTPLKVSSRPSRPAAFIQAAKATPGLPFSIWETVHLETPILAAKSSWV